MRRTVEERFWSHVNKTDGCWEWTASLRGSGYGQFRVAVGTSPVRAHRFVWTLTYGAIPDGLFVCHHCDNRKCVRPDHLFLGTSQHNVADMFRKDRQSGVDRRRGQAKLTPKSVIEIREVYAAGGESARQLAERYGVHFTTIIRAVSHKHWAELPDRAERESRHGILAGPC